MAQLFNSKANESIYRTTSNLGSAIKYLDGNNIEILKIKLDGRTPQIEVANNFNLEKIFNKEKENFNTSAGIVISEKGKRLRQGFRIFDVNVFWECSIN